MQLQKVTDFDQLHQIWVRFNMMSLFGVNMAVPIKENIRESRIYFLSSVENVPQENYTLDKKYLVFKTIQLVSLVKNCIFLIEKLRFSRCVLLCSSHME